MKQFLLLGFVVIVILNGCNYSSKEKKTENGKAKNDSIQIVLKPYENTTDVIEYEIPVFKGTSKKHGIQKRFYRSGSIYSSVPYLNGSRQGVAYTYYQAAEGVKPVVWKEQPYVNNVLTGVCKRYHNDGTLQAEYEYKNGNPGVGLIEYNRSGKLIEQPGLIVTKNKVATGYYVSASLSKKADNIDYFVGELDEGKYLPKGLKGLQIRNGVGEIVVSSNKKQVTITAVYYTRYRNKGIVSKTINLK